MTIGYARISTRLQKEDRQVDSLNQYGCDKIYIDKISGTTKNRPEFIKMLEHLRGGDKVVVMRLSRIGRSVKHLIELKELFEEKQIEFVSLNESIDTSTAVGKLVFNMLSSISQFEADLISERTIEGLRAARRKGRVGGRPRGITNEKAANLAVKLYKSEEYTVKEMLDMTNLSRSTFYKYLKLKGVLETHENTN